LKRVETDKKVIALRVELTLFPLLAAIFAEFVNSYTIGDSANAINPRWSQPASLISNPISYFSLIKGIRCQGSNVRVAET
jgi:hypothetical protein